MVDHVRFTVDQPLPELVAAARNGHAAAWNALVERLQRVVWKSVNMMTSDADVRDDAFAATWLRLAERLDTIREPEKLPGWLATTACNEVRQIVRRRGPAAASLDDVGVTARLATADPEPGARMIAAEDHRAVRTAFDRLDEPCRELLTVLVMADVPVPYDVAGARLARPVGSLGPSRRRCLEKLRQLLTPADGSQS